MLKEMRMDEMMMVDGGYYTYAESRGIDNSEIKTSDVVWGVGAAATAGICGATAGAAAACYVVGTATSYVARKVD